jgi:putative endonuclease
MEIEPETGPFWVYALVSQSTGRRYIGQTQDLNRRLTEHNTPEHNPRKFTSRNVGPWRLVYSDKHATRAVAMQRERWLKSGTGRAWLDSSIGRASPPAAD